MYSTLHAPPMMDLAIMIIPTLTILHKIPTDPCDTCAKQLIRDCHLVAS